MPASIESGETWRVYRNNSGVQLGWALVVIAIIILALAVAAPPRSLMQAARPDSAAFALVPLLVGTMGVAAIRWRQSTRVDKQAGIVEISQGWGEAKPYKQFQLSDFVEIELFRTGRGTMFGFKLSGGWQESRPKCVITVFDSAKDRDAAAKDLGELLKLPLRDPYNP